MKMKKVLCGLAAMTMLFTSTACGKEKDDKVTINLMAFTEEVPGMVQKYLDTHPDFAKKYKVKTTVKATDNGAYQDALDLALANNNSDSPDMYCAEAAFILKYSQGDLSKYAATYEELGIENVEGKIKDAEIAQYSVDLGTRDGKVVALGYQATGGAFIYRRSLAKDVFGTDDPATVAEKIGAGTNSWDKFFDAAEDMSDKGYAMLSGDGDLWHAVENSSSQGWVVDNKLTIDPKREDFLDLSKELYDNEYINGTTDWQEGWFNDMKDAGPKKVFGFFGPAWLINYTMADNCGGKAVGEGTYGDWAVCPPPVGFFWGGTWLLANKDASDEKKKAIGEIIEWITLDATKDGLQYMWANGTYNPEKPTKDVVASAKVMAMSDGKVDFLGGQNMFDVFVPANEYANGKNLTQYDEKFNKAFRDQVTQYVEGKKSRDEAIEEFKKNVKDTTKVEVD